MKKLLLILVLAVMFGCAVKAVNFDDGVEAYDKGDYATAITLWRSLAEQGHPRAQNNLGIIYFNGTGVTQSYVNAYMWLSLAISNGSEHGNESREMVAQEMTPAQIEEAQKMAKDCEKKKYKNCD